MKALSHAGFATVGNLSGIDSHYSEGNEVKWEGGCLLAARYCGTLRDTLGLLSPVLLQKVSLLGFIGKRSAHCPYVLTYVGLISS